MTSEIKKMTKVSKMQADVSRDMDAMSMTGKFLRECTAMKEAFAATAASFNAMREELAKAKNCVWSMDVDAKQYAANLTSKCGFDCATFVSKVWGEGLHDLDDADRFEAALLEIGTTGNPLQRIRKCVKAKESLDASIAGWQSKVEAMRERAGRADANQNEREICDRKIFGFEKMIETLKTRRDSIVSVFHDTKRDVLAFVAKQAEKFAKEA